MVRHHYYLYPPPKSCWLDSETLCPLDLLIHHLQPPLLRDLYTCSLVRIAFSECDTGYDALLAKADLSQTRNWHHHLG